MSRHRRITPLPYSMRTRPRIGPSAAKRHILLNGFQPYKSRHPVRLSLPPCSGLAATSAFATDPSLRPTSLHSRLLIPPSASRQLARSFIFA
jgi:hypothetical protein